MVSLTRALPPSPENLPHFEDLFTPSHGPDCQHHHHPEPEKPAFHLLDNLGRVPTKCYTCGGSGKCQYDYPGPGSGKDWKEEKEYYCSGSGKCGRCGGSGWTGSGGW